MPVGSGSSRHGRNAPGSPTGSRRDASSGFTLVEMVVAVTVVLLMVGAGLLAAPAIIRSAMTSACDAAAGSVSNAVNASFAATGDYSRAAANDLVADGFLVASPTSAQFELTGVTAEGVTVEFGDDCSDDTAPGTWGPDAQANGAYQFGVSAVPPATVPDAPTDLVATPGDEKVTLTWDAPASDGGSAITGYTAEFSTISGTGFLPAVTGCTGLGNVLTCVVTGVTNGIDLYFRVAAVNGVGTSAWSAEAGPVAANPVDCQDGGTCVLGDIGPGGGAVFYVDDGGFLSNGQTANYLEVASGNWMGGGSDPSGSFGCNFTAISGADGIGIGDGAVNSTVAAAQNCTAVVNATAYNGGGKSDWYLPSRGELVQLCLAASGEPTGPTTLGDTCTGPPLGLAIQSALYLSSSLTGSNTQVWQLNMADGQGAEGARGVNRRYRPIRAFAPTA